MLSERRFLQALGWLLSFGLLACTPADVPVTSSDTESSETTATAPPADASSTAQADTSSTVTSSTADASSEASTTGSDGTSSASSDSTTDTSATESTSTGPDPVCGDAIVEGEEDCDDGGESARCNVDCTVSTCGDGIFNAASGELCDEGGSTPLCDADCTLVACGDGNVSAAAGEACDDAGESATCNSDCSLAACGDGITNLTAGEACDDTGESASCDADCSLAACGDGTINAIAGEACDDVDESASCDADCSLAECGDGLANATADEACDGSELLGSTCQTQGFLAGTLACTPACAYDVGGCANLPGTPVLALGFSAIKQFDFSWAAVAGADSYQLEESAEPGEPFVQLGADIIGTSISHTMPLHLRREASYRLRACNVAGCTDSAVVDVASSLAEAVGYFKASNTGFGDIFGYRVALSGDGSTLAVSAFYEASNATGINGNQASNLASEAGAVYVFARDAAGTWSQQAYVKASNTNSGDLFCVGLALSYDGDTLAVGAYQEDSNATGVGGNQLDNSSTGSGAAYVFARDDAGTWTQQAYVKASNANMFDWFGYRLSLSDDGDTLAVSGYAEDSSASGVGGNQLDNAAQGAGAVYVFVRDDAGAWSQQAYVKASNPASQDYFGTSVALSGDGDTLGVGAWWEDSAATGINGNQADDSATDSGAVYVFVRDDAGTWSQQAYVKASNTTSQDWFGERVALSGDGDTLAVAAQQEDSSATGIDGDQANDTASNAGAVYVFVRDGVGAWSQQAYVKASNASASDRFGDSLAISGSGDILAVGAVYEGSNAVGIGGDQANNAGGGSGAAYVFVRDALGAWSQRAYVKASNPALNDNFGRSISLSASGEVLAVGAYGEDSNATGVGGNQGNDLASGSGAVYLY